MATEAKQVPNYPKWAPPSLVEKHVRLLAVHATSSAIGDDDAWKRSYREVMGRLLTYHCMNWGWSELKKRTEIAGFPFPFGPKYGTEERWLDAVLLEVAIAIHGLQDEPRTRGDKAQQHMRIAKLARDLAREIGGSPLDRSPDGGVLRFLSDGLSAGILSRLDASLWEGDYCDANYYGMLHAPTGDIFPTLPPRDGLFRSLDLYLHLSSKEVRGSDSEPRDLAGFLVRVAEAAEAVSRSAITEERVVERVTENYQRNYFVRKIARFLWWNVGQVLRGTVANIATAALNCPVSERDVESALTGYDLEGA